jgi:4-hydroxy-tetrahydrodipicolinate synthase
MLQGSLVAIVTPMQEDGALDINALRSLIDFHIEEGTDGIVIVGTTGESPTVNFEEHCLLIKTAVEHTAGRIPVIAGTGANATTEAIELTQHAKNLGADACLLVTPYYNKPPQEGLYQHYRAVAESVDIPQILYNVPGRTACDITNDTVLRLSQIPNIVGIKDATGNMERGSDLMMGGCGVISVTANAAPRLMHELCVAAMAGDAITARKINDKLLALHQKLFVEANPIPVKWVLQQMGLIKPGIRLPLVPLSAAYHDTLRLAMKSAGI